MSAGIGGLISAGIGGLIIGLLVGGALGAMLTELMISGDTALVDRDGKPIISEEVHE